MKKQLAVLMAAATAVTTVAPAVANAADTKTNSTDFVAKAKTALAEKYTADTKETGLELPGSTSYTGDKAYLNSKNVVVLDVKVAVEAGKLEGYGLKDVSSADQGIEKKLKDLIAKYVATDAERTHRYVVTDAAKLANYIETLGNGDAKLTILKKGELNGKSYVSVKKDANQVYVAKGTLEADGLLAGASVELKKGDTADKNVVPATLLNRAIDSIDAYTVTGDKESITLGNDATGALNDTLEKVGATDKYYTKVVVNLKSGKTLEFAVGSEAYDFDAPYDVKDQPMKNVQDLINDDAVAANLAGFKKKVATADKDVLLAPSVATSYVLYDVDSVETIDLGTVYTYDNGYTEDGAKKVNNLRELTGKVVGGTNYINGTYNYKGDTYKLQEGKNPASDIGYEITANDKGYTLAVTIPVVNNNDSHVKKTLQFKFDGLSQQDLVKVMGDLKENKEAVVGRYKRLEGTDRYQTAIEVSKEQYKDKNAKSVVIVGGNALLDGLCAAPLASAKEAPVLLAHPKTGLSADTLAEVKRATEEGGLKDKTVYIVGGTDSVPASVEKQLSDLGAVVVRVAGADRYATSKAIAERLYYDNNNLGIYYYVGGNGAADAMSIAPVASRIKKVSNNNLVSPILLVGKNGLSQETRNFLINSAQNSEVASKYDRGYVVGGFNSVSSEAYKVIKEAALKANASSTLERVSGDDRYATNLAVLDKFYVAGNETENVGKPTGLFVSSGSDKALVDAQVVGAFARSSSAGAETAKSTPIMLVGNKLTDDQTKYLKTNKATSATEGIQAGNVYKVGGAVASDAMKAVVDALDIR